MGGLGVNSKDDGQDDLDAGVGTLGTALEPAEKLEASDDGDNQPDDREAAGSLGQGDGLGLF